MTKYLNHSVSALLIILFPNQKAANPSFRMLWLILRVSMCDDVSDGSTIVSHSCSRDSDKCFNITFDLVIHPLHVFISHIAMHWVFFVAFRPLILSRKMRSTGLPLVLNLHFNLAAAEPDIHRHTHTNGERLRERKRERERKRDCACCMFLFCVFTTQTQHKEHTVKFNDQRNWLQILLTLTHDLVFSSSWSLVML